MADRPLLVRGPLAAVIAPDLGGSVLGFAAHGRPVLRRRAEARHVLDSACYPLVPYCNRLPGDAARLGGRAWAVPPNFGTPPRACHGDGWLSAWTVEALSADRAVLAHAAAGSPWTYAARQEIRLEDDGLSLRLEVRNDARETMPFGLGFHPFFPDPDAARAAFRVRRFWLEGPDRLPTEPVSVPPELDFAGGRPIPRAWRNNCHDGWDGVLDVEWADGRGLRLEAGPGAVALHLYRPPEEDFFCLEPQSHVSGAVGRPDGAAHGVTALPPGGVAAFAMRIALSGSWSGPGAEDGA